MSVLTPVRFPPPLAERTPADWRDLLLGRLAVQVQEATLYEDYYVGRHRLQFATTKFREAFGALFSAFADNWCGLVVDAPVERLEVVGFRTGGRMPEADEDAWKLWQANGLDLESVIAHTEAGKCGIAYLMVDPTGEEPRITVEHPSQVVVALDPESRRRRLAALKRWQGDDGLLYCTLYLPDVALRWVSSDVPDYAGGRRKELEWVPRPDGLVPNPLGVVPVIPMVNRPQLMADRGVSDLQVAIPLQDAINKFCTDMLVASEFGAFPQRVLMGVEVPRDPETGQMLAHQQIVAAMSRLWTFDSPDASVSSLPATDLANYVNALTSLRQDLSAQTRTPPHYMLGQVVNASGDALKVAEAGLVEKCRLKIKCFSDPWEEAMSLALQAAGRTDVSTGACEALWADPERTSLAELVDACVKKLALGVPQEVVWREAGYTPQEISDMKAMVGQPVRLPASTPPAGPGGEVPPATTTMQ